jgi:phasin
MSDQSSNDPFGLGGMPNAQAMMGMDPAKLTEAFRSMSEKSVEQSRQAYQRMKSAADEATKSLETTMENAHQGSLNLSKKAVDAMRRNAELGFSHIESLMSAKSVAEIIELQSSYVRKQVELTTDQVKEMQSLTQSLAKEMLKPGRDAFTAATNQKI